jgi:hypothetical protein
MDEDAKIILEAQKLVDMRGHGFVGPQKLNAGKGSG